MVESIIFGLTIGSILYCFSVGLAITFGTMRIINFAHGGMYVLGVYFLILFLQITGNNYILSVLLSLILIVPLGYIVERFVVRRLYGESIDYAVIATWGVLLIITDLVKWYFGAVPLAINVPTRASIALFGVSTIPVYRLMVIAVAILVFVGLILFFRYTIAGKVIMASLDDSDGVKCLGIWQAKFFSLVFVLGSVLAALGGIMYGPISAADPYMGFLYLQLSFAVVIVGGLGKIKGAFYSSFILGLTIAISARFVPRLSYMMVFLIMALVLVIRRGDDEESFSVLIKRKVGQIRKTLGHVKSA